MEASLIEWFRAAWPVIASLASILSILGMAWLSTKFAPLNKHEALVRTVDDHTTRLRVLEEHLEASPTRQELQEDISELGERMSGVEAGLRGMTGELRSTNQLIHTLIDKAIPPAGGR